MISEHGRTPGGQVEGFEGSPGAVSSGTCLLGVVSKRPWACSVPAGLAAVPTHRVGGISAGVAPRIRAVVSPGGKALARMMAGRLADALDSHHGPKHRGA